MRKTFFSIGILVALILTIPAISGAAEVRGVTDTEVVTFGPSSHVGCDRTGGQSLG